MSTAAHPLSSLICSLLAATFHRKHQHNLHTHKKLAPTIPLVARLMVGLMRLITISLALNQAAPDCPALAPSGTSSVPHSSGPIDTFRSKTQCNAKRATGRVKKVCTDCPNCPANCWNASNSTTTPKNCKPWPPARPANSSNIWHTENTVIAQLILLLLRFIGQAPGFGAGQCRAFLSVEKLMLFGASGEHETRQQKLLYKTFAKKKKLCQGRLFITAHAVVVKCCCDGAAGCVPVQHTTTKNCVINFYAT